MYKARNTNKSDMKKFHASRTIQFFGLVFLGGGADIVTQLIQQESIDWRSVVLAAIGIAGIGFRMVTTQAIK